MLVHILSFSPPVSVESCEPGRAGLIIIMPERVAILSSAAAAIFSRASQQVMVLIRPTVTVAVMQAAAFILGFYDISRQLTPSLREVQMFILVLSSILEVLGFNVVIGESVMDSHVPVIVELGYLSSCDGYLRR